MVVGACKKYDEGPLISLRTKESRLCREWKLDKYTVNGVEQANDANGTLEFKKDGSLTDTYHTENLGVLEFRGTWHFTQDKKYIEISELSCKIKKDSYGLSSLFKNISDAEWTEYEIMRLTAKEFFIVRYVNTADELRFEYKAK
jgi:hypothetical protein